MPVEKSAGAVVFMRKKGKIYYLLLRHAQIGRIKRPYSGRQSPDILNQYWNFPKGRIEKGENIYKTAIRETREETGLKDLRILRGFKGMQNYFFKHQGKTIFKIAIFLLAETKTEDIKISSEHAGYKWLPYKKARLQLTFQNAKNILKEANDFLSTKSLSSRQKNPQRQGPNL